MHGTVARKELLAEVAPMLGVIAGRTTIPILSHVMLRMEAPASDDVGRLSIGATDLEVSLTSECPCDVEEDGAIAVEAKRLVELLRASDGDDVELRTGENGQSLHVLTGNAKFKIRAIGEDDFPTLPDLSDVDAREVPFKTLKNAIQAVFFAVSTTESRFQLCGALMELSGNTVRLVATDGHRMALAEAEVADLEADVEGELVEGEIVARKALQELLRLEHDGDVGIRWNENHLSFTLGARQLICRIMEGSFPDYKRVISRETGTRITLNVKALSAVVHRVGLLAGDRSRVVKMSVEQGRLLFTSANPDLGEASEELEVDSDVEEEKILGMNPDYVEDALAVITEENMELQFTDDSSPVVVVPSDGDLKRQLCVIMPVNLA